MAERNSQTSAPAERRPDWPDLFRSWALWPDIFGHGWPRLPMFPEAWRRLTEEESLRVEEFVEGDELVVKAEIPGIDPDRDVDIHISQGALHIRAERRQQSKTEDKEYYRSELQYGSFRRTIPLPSDADESKVTASYEDGILEIRLPVAKAEAGATKVPVSRK